MVTGMLVDLKVHHGGILRHAPFSYIDGDVHDVQGYDVQFFTMWKLKQLVQDFRYVNDFKCWYNVGAKDEQAIPLSTDANIVEINDLISKILIFIEY